MRIALIGIATLFCFALAGCGGSDQSRLDELVSSEIGAKAFCAKNGPEEVAGEREMTYSCSWQESDGKAKYAYDRQWHSTCAALIDGDAYVIRETC